MKLGDIIYLASSQVGYYEKSSKTSDLDCFDPDGALNNYTKYARDLKAAGYYGNKNKNGYNWCAVFVDWLVYQLCGDNASAYKPLGTYGASCTWTKKYYKNAGRLGTVPALGAQVFFKNSAGEVYHTGLVVAVDDFNIVTIEGNTTDGSVKRKSYKRNSRYIDSYGYILYDSEEKKPFARGDKVVLKTEYYANGKHIAASVRKHPFVYVIKNNGETCSISKYASLLYTGTVITEDIELYE